MFQGLFDCDYVERNVQVEEAGRRASVKIWLSEAASTDFDKTGAILWPATYTLARFVVRHGAELFRNKTVVELGSGMGLPSAFIAAQRTCRLLVGTDHQRDIVDKLDENLKANFGSNDEHPSSLSSESERVSGSASSIESENARTEEPLAMKLNWGSAKHHEQLLALAAEHVDGFRGFDFVVASDVVYEAEAAHALLSSVVALLADDGRFVMAHRTRWTAVDDALADAWQRFGLVPAELPSPKPLLDTIAGDQTLFVVMKKPSPSPP
jgi:predicted nicotinamide N-methyase